MCVLANLEYLSILFSAVFWADAPVDYYCYYYYKICCFGAYERRCLNYTRMSLRPSAVCSYVYRILYITNFSELSLLQCISVG